MDFAKQSYSSAGYGHRPDHALYCWFTPSLKYLIKACHLNKIDEHLNYSLYSLMWLCQIDSAAKPFIVKF